MKPPEGDFKFEREKGAAMVIDKKHVCILVVDDEAGMRDMLSLALGSQGYQVATAVNGIEALEQIQKQRFDLVITDLKMPEMDGIDLLDQIKKIAPKLEVIMTTGHGTVEAAVAAMKSGAFDFILKPFPLDELNAIIEKVLEKKELKTLIALYEASNAIFSTMELDKLLEVIMDMSQKVLGADEGSIMLLSEDKKLRIAASRGLASEVARQVQLEIGERVAGLVAKEKRGRLFINGLEKYEELKGISGKPGIRSSIVCPLLSQNELLGVLNLNRTTASENFTMADFQYASVFAAQASLAIQNAKLYSTLQEAYQRLEKTQGELLQSEKLASIGRLVAGVAHELNNPLTSVIGYSQLAQETKSLDEIHRQLPIIYSEAIRCSKIVKNLLLFARRQRPDHQSVDIGRLVEDAFQGLSLEMEKQNIHFKKDFPAEPVLLQADPHLLGQVFANIFTNACQALAEVSHERLLEVKVGVVNENVQLSFKDNGPGIPKENIHRIFDPFYTTKEVGKGTGLGLSLSYGIIKEHDGSLSVESVPGKETVFMIQLPLKAKEEMPANSPERPKESRLKLPADAQILLVEDEEPIRSLVTRIFHEQNYHLEVATDGEMALEKLKNHDYDLILCDYRMPKLDGVSFFEEARKREPKLLGRFLFISGSTEFMQNFDSFFKENRLGCLLKPFTKDELISAVNAAVENIKGGKEKK